MKIEMLKVKDLKPYKKNAKKHPKKQIERIANSIEMFGMNDPVAIWKDNVIISGPGRLEISICSGVIVTTIGSGVRYDL